MLKNKFLYTFLLLLVSIIISVSWFGRLIDEKMSDYVTDEVDKVSKILIRKILNEEFFRKIDLKNLFVVSRGNDGEIDLIDLNTEKINDILGQVNNEIIYYFNEFDNGNIDLISKYSDIFSKYVEGNEKGLFIVVPIGIVFSNPVLFSIGPKVPIKLLLTGQVESNVITTIKQYGINNILFEIDIEINVKEKIIFPFTSRYVSVKLQLPLIIELISGKVPENYLNSQNSGIIK